MKTSTKRSMKLVAVLLVLVMAIGGSLAYFTDYAETSADGKAGTVDIVLDSEINLLDDDGKDILNPGDWREANFRVSNFGNKSVDIRTTITLTSSVPMVTDENGQAQFELYVFGDFYSIPGAGVGLVEGATPLEVRSISADGKTITYNIPDYILNGSPAGEAFLGIPVGGDGDYEEEPDALQNGDIKGVNSSGNAAAHMYSLVFRGDSSNDYQGATVTLKVLVEAKQHRNTEAGWELVAEEGAVVVGNGYADGEMSGEDVVLDANGNVRPEFMDNLIGSTTNWEKINNDYYQIYACYDKTYIVRNSTFKCEAVDTLSYSTNNGITTATFIYDGQTFVIEAPVAYDSPITNLTVDGVEVETDDANLYNNLLADGYTAHNISVSGTEYIVLTKETPVVEQYEGVDEEYIDIEIYFFKNYRGYQLFNLDHQEEHIRASDLDSFLTTLYDGEENNAIYVSYDKVNGWSFN